jgi:hypothetical protein
MIGLMVILLCVAMGLGLAARRAPLWSEVLRFLNVRPGLGFGIFCED